MRGRPVHALFVASSVSSFKLHKDSMSIKISQVELRHSLRKLLWNRALFAQRIKPGGDCRQTAERLFRIHRREMRPLRRHFILRENCFHRTLRHTRVTVDARLRIDHQHIVVKMKSLNRTDQCAIRIAAIDAGFRNGVSHSSWPPPQSLQSSLTNRVSRAATVLAGTTDYQTLSILST